MTTKIQNESANCNHLLFFFLKLQTRRTKVWYFHNIQIQLTQVRLTNLLPILLANYIKTVKDF